MSAAITPAATLRPGVEVNFAGHVLTVPPLHRLLWKKHASTSFKKLAELEPAMKLSQDMSAAEQSLDLQSEVVLDALRLNYPGLTQEQFDEIADVVSMQAAFPAAMGDIDRARSAAEKNVRAVSRSGILIGMQTPPESLPTPDGALPKLGP